MPSSDTATGCALDSATPAPDVSYVVIAYNERPNLARTVASIHAQSGTHTYEVVVVNDGSTDGTGAVLDGLASDDARVRAIHQPNLGRGAARARGVAAVVGRYIAMIDGDIVLGPEWTERCLDALTDTDAVGGIPVPDGDVAYPYRRCALTPKATATRTTVTGSNGLYRRAVFEAVAFDGSHRDGEDVALNEAMAAAGLCARAITDLVVAHEEHKTYWASLRWLYQSGRGATRQWRRTRKIRFPDVSFIAFLLACGASIAAWLMGVPVVALAIPGCLLLGGGAHIATRFHTPPAATHRVLAACVIDATLLASYFVGRAAATQLPKWSPRLTWSAELPARPAILVANDPEVPKPCE